MQKFIAAPVLSKEAQSNVAADLVAQVINGDVDPVQAFVHMKAISEVVDIFLKHPEVIATPQSAVAEVGKKFAHLTANLTTADLAKVFNGKDPYSRTIDRFKTYNVIPLPGENRR